MNASASNLPLRRQTNSSGFTLIELMVTIAVLAIIVSIAAPSINDQLAQNQIKMTSTIIQTSIARAKAESAISHSDVIWSYNNTNKRIALSNRGETIASYNLNDNSGLTFDPVTQTTFVISKESMINTATGTAVNVAIDVSDGRVTGNTRRIRVNNKRAFECSGSYC